VELYTYPKRYGAANFYPWARIVSKSNRYKRQRPVRGRVEILRRYFGCIQSYCLSSASFLSLNITDEVAKLRAYRREKSKKEKKKKKAGE
jgi:hypothetical protein